MGFVDSFLTWLALILIVAFLLFVVFSYILGWFYPADETEEEEEERELVSEDDDNQKEAQQRRKLLGIFVLVAIIAIMATSGYNAFMNTRSN